MYSKLTSQPLSPLPNAHTGILSIGGEVYIAKSQISDCAGNGITLLADFDFNTSICQIDGYGDARMRQFARLLNDKTCASVQVDD